MDEVKYQELKTRYQTANGLRSRIAKCKDQVKRFSNHFDNAIHGSARQDWAKGNLDYWLYQLDKANKKYSKF